MGGPAEGFSSSPGPPSDTAGPTGGFTAVEPPAGIPTPPQSTWAEPPPVPSQPESIPETASKQEKKDLMAMMMQCSDLTAPQKAKGFVKPSMKEIQPAKRSATTYQESKQARRWDAATDSLTELFTVPAPPLPVHIQQSETTPSSQAPPNQAPPTSQAVPNQAPVTAQAPPKMPRWVTGDAPVPDVYRMVLEAATIDGKISTEHLYPILMRSNLPREGLGFLWNLCNKETPGQLSKSELFMLLAMISVVQNNMNFTSLDILSRCPKAPIPNLGQYTGSQPPQTSTNQQPGQAPVPTTSAALQPGGGVGAIPPSAVPPGGVIGAVTSSAVPPGVVGAVPSSGVVGAVTPGGFAGAVPPGVPPGVFVGAVPPDGVSSSIENTETADSEFADFQTAPPAQPTGPSHSVSFGDFAVATQNVSTSTAPNVASSVPSPPEEPTRPADKYAAFQELHSECDKEEDIDEYFKSEVPPLPVTVEPFKRNTRYNQDQSKQKLETDFPVAPADPIMTKVKSEPLMPDFENFAAFAASHSESSSSQSQGWTSSSSNSGFTTGSSNTDDFADFAVADNQEDEFADFQQATDLASGTAPQKTDKLSALKALVQNKTLFTDKPQAVSIAEIGGSSLSTEPSPGEGGVSKPTTIAEPDDDWSNFSSVSIEQKDVNVMKPGNVYDALKSMEPVTETSPQMDWFSATSTSTPNLDKPPPPSDTNWAAFSGNASADNLGNSVSNTSLASGPGIDVNTKQSSEQRASNIQVDKSKSDKMFSKNLNPRETSFSTFGVSAFDMAPPDLPDMKDDEEEFDEFGTFQAGHGTLADTEGISSLAAGIDDFADFSVATNTATYKPVNKFISQQTVISSSTLAPNKDTSDTVSMSSMEFSGWKSPSEPSQITEDTQSTRSLELQPPQKEDSPSGGDSQSVSSLDFTPADRKSITPQDERSVASLELKQASETATSDNSPAAQDKVLGQENTMTESFGEFSSAAVTSPDDGSSANQWSKVIPDMPAQKPRDVSELMTQGDLITVGDRYSGLIKEPQDTDKHAYHWQRCLEKAKKLLIIASDSLQTTSKSDVCKEIVSSEKGATFMKGIIEVYRVTSRIKQAMRSLSISNQKLVSLVQEVEETWANMSIFLTETHLMPEKAAMDFSKAVLKATDNYSQHKSCGICLLDVDAKCRPSNVDNGHKLTYGGRQYHSSCANFWVNCVNSTLPALGIPELL